MELNISTNDYNCIGVYVIINTLNNKKYIGSTTKGFYKRWTAYKNAYKQNINKKLKNSIIKNGIENFSFSIVEKTLLDKVREREEFYIKDFNTIKNGYNIKYNGTGGNGGANKGKKYPSPSPEVVRKRAEKISLTKKGKAFSKEHCQAISNSKRGCKPSHSLIVSLVSIKTGRVLYFNSATEASKKLSCSIQQICSLIKGNSKLLKKEFIIHQ
jgi:group I intron endonuclease